MLTIIYIIKSNGKKISFQWKWWQIYILWKFEKIKQNKNKPSH